MSAGEGSLLQELKAKKGELSRKIGEAKKSGNSIETLLEEMKATSARLKELEAKSKAPKPTTDGAETDRPEGEQTPQLFSISFEDSLAGKLADRIFLCDESAQAAWSEYVQNKPGASLYHEWRFKEVIEETFGHNTLYFAAYDQAQRICGVLPVVEIKSALFGHFMCSMPYFNYGGLLADSPDIEKQLLGALSKEAGDRGAKHAELRHTRSIDGVPEKTGKITMLLSMPKSADQLWSDIGTKVRAQVKKAERFDLSIEFGGLELLDDFYRVFAENMRDLGTPVYGSAFFENLLRMTSSGSCEVGVVYHSGKPVACCFLMGYRDTLEIPWASTLRQANTMNANMFMYWSVLKRAVDKGYAFFDFGRSSKDASTYRFKKQWGGRPRQLYWHYWLDGGGELPELNPNNPKYRLLIAVWQKLPVWFTKFLGPRVVKYLP